MAGVLSLTQETFLPTSPKLKKRKGEDGQVYLMGNSHPVNILPFNLKPAYNLRSQGISATEESVTYDQSDTDDEEFVPNNHSIQQLHKDITLTEESDEFQANFALIIKKLNQRKAEKLQK